MSAVTKHLGFGVTSSVIHEHPYTFARKISTLDHLTNGHVGWNIVTSYLKSASVNMGLDEQISHDERYDIAEEYLQVCLKLSEESWEDDAVKVDKANRIYTDPTKVHDIEHRGEILESTRCTSERTISTADASHIPSGASTKGRSFAARHAEVIFIGAPNKNVAKETVRKIREEVKKAGRPQDGVKIITMFVPITGSTEEEAKRKYEDYKSYISKEGALALFGGWTGVDVSGYAPDQEIKYIENDAIRSALENFTKLKADRASTVQDVIDAIGIGGMVLLR